MYIGPRIPEERFSEWDLVEPRGMGMLLQGENNSSPSFIFRVAEEKRRAGVRKAALARSGRRVVDGKVVAKQCNICGRLLAFFDFHKKPGTFDGRDASCKRCRNAQERMRYGRRGRVTTHKTPCRKPEGT
jgi:hypothetical protein